MPRQVQHLLAEVGPVSLGPSSGRPLAGSPSRDPEAAGTLHTPCPGSGIMARYRNGRAPDSARIKHMCSRCNKHDRFQGLAIVDSHDAGSTVARGSPLHTLAGVGAWRRLRCGSLEASRHESGAPLQLITCSSFKASSAAWATSCRLLHSTWVHRATPSHMAPSIQALQHSGQITSHGLDMGAECRTL